MTSATSELYVQNLCNSLTAKLSKCYFEPVLSTHTVGSFVSSYVSPRLATRTGCKCNSSKTAPYSLSHVGGVKLTAACRYYLSFRNWNRILTITNHTDWQGWHASILNLSRVILRRAENLNTCYYLSIHASSHVRYWLLSCVSPCRWQTSHSWFYNPSYHCTYISVTQITYENTRRSVLSKQVWPASPTGGALKSLAI